MEKSSLRKAGSVSTDVVGIQYYEYNLSVDEKIHCDRNPANEFDFNAIEVRSENDNAAGHIPRYHALYLGPLIDRGWIFLKGIITGQGDKWKMPLVLEIMITLKGESIFKNNDLKEPEAFIHRQFVSLYNESEGLSSASLKSVLSYFKEMPKKNLWPETLLLYHILHEKVKEKQKAETADRIKNAAQLLSSLKYGPAAEYGGITVVPLFMHSYENPLYAHGMELVSNKEISINEISDNGDVNSLKCTNKSDAHALFYTGQGVRGAKQDRIITMPFIVSAGEEIKIPAACVEQGRWSMEEEDFSAGNFANAKMRQKIMDDTCESSLDGDFTCDQSGIWAEVDVLMQAAGAESYSSNLNDIYEQKNDSIKDYSENIPFVDNASGLAVFKGKELKLVEIFHHPHHAEKMWQGIVSSFAVESENPGDSKKNNVVSLNEHQDKINDDEYHSAIREITQNFEEFSSGKVKNPGRGEYFALTYNNANGGILMDETNVAHFSMAMQ